MNYLSKVNMKINNCCKKKVKSAIIIAIASNTRDIGRSFVIAILYVTESDIRNYGDINILHFFIILITDSFDIDDNFFDTHLNDEIYTFLIARSMRRYLGRASALSIVFFV